jgi:NADH-quinone oxidoreductase subunit J
MLSTDNRKEKLPFQSEKNMFRLIRDYLTASTRSTLSISVTALSAFLLVIVVSVIFAFLCKNGLGIISLFAIPALAVFFATAVPAAFSPITALLNLLGLFGVTVLMYLTLGAEYLALVFLIVYIGGLAIIFLFVIMLINVKEITSSQKKALPEGTYLYAVVWGLTVFLLLASQMGNAFDVYFIGTPFAPSELVVFTSLVLPDIMSLSSLFGTDASLFVLITGILLLSMLGAIIIATQSMSNKENPVKSVNRPFCTVDPYSGGAGLSVSDRGDFSTFIILIGLFLLTACLLPLGLR